MERMVRAGLIQATLCEDATAPIEKIKQAMIDKHVALIEEAAQKGAQVVCVLTGNGLKDPDTAIEYSTIKPTVLPNDDEIVINEIVGRESK